jgi:hypothetical protein
MRPDANADKLQQFLAEIGKHSNSPGKLYLTGGATAVLHGWRSSTTDVDIKFDPEPQGIFEAIRDIKEELEINIELAAPDQFIPEIPGWQERSFFVGMFGKVEVYHYDFYAQALAKIERGHERDLIDVRAMCTANLINTRNLRRFFNQIKPLISRYPSLDADTFQAKVDAFIVEEDNKKP